MYAERIKSRSGILDEGTRRILEVYIPSFSVCALLGVTGYITYQAILTITATDKGDEGDNVNVYFLWSFSTANFCVDVISSFLFYWRGKDVFLSTSDSHNNRGHAHAPLRTFSLDRRSFDMEKRSILPVSSILPKNLNMISALTHVGGDTLRTVSVFIAAFIATVTRFSSTLCDAWASVVVCFSILICIIPLCIEIYKAAFHLSLEHDEGDDGNNDGNGGSERVGKYTYEEVLITEDRRLSDNVSMKMRTNDEEE
jgi:Co/Zn/Cd efflux system component